MAYLYMSNHGPGPSNGPSQTALLFMRIQKLSLAILFMFVHALSLAQLEANTWHFGLNAGLNFNTNPPTVTTTGQIFSREGVATVSDKTTGQLLFYSEGTTVWNRNHAVMPNGNGLLGDFSSTQSAIAVPKPGSATRYYLFTTALLKGMYYSEVDMALAGGNGDIVAGTKNTLLISGSESSEKLIAVQHCNGAEYWVITHKLFSNSFVVYLVNAAGVQPGITYNIGALLADANGWTGVGYLKLSPTGNRLAHVIGPAASGLQSNVELLNFDNKTGIISGPVTVLTNFNFPYGAEFSPRGRYLYISENLGRRIFQYDLAAANINGSQVLIQPPNINYGALQLGPDGKIYVAAENGYNVGYNFLGRIENPDAAGTACNFVPNAVNLGLGRTLIGLPTLATNFLLKDSTVINYSGLCKGISGNFSFTNIPNVDSVKWNFGDGSPISTQLAPAHTYATANTFNVQLILYKSCNRNDTVYKPVTVANCAANCDNWLSTPSLGSYVTVGDLDVTGNQITVEANFNRSQALNSGLYYGHLVSKHTNGTNVNYALLPNGCEITTSTGYHATFQNCQPQLNKLYHVALVYDGTALKFYRNGFLISQVACTGSIVTNDLLTTIAQVSSSGSPSDNQFLGYVNEVRIWNVARTQAQLQTYMNSSLPNPTTQPGLLGYYTFDNLLNKQGNAAYNGTLNGAATINATNTNCNFVADSCRVNTPIGNVINAYTPVLGLEPCGNKITVENATAYNVGDTVLLIQMKGAVIDSSNTSAFGTVTDYKSAGNYEFNYVKSKLGNTIELKNKLTRTYEIPNGKVQLIRVPYYDNATITSTLTCLPWDGSKGGVLVFNVADSLVLAANIDVTGKGFRGGNTYNVGPAVLNCFQDAYFYDSSSTVSSRKGEGIADMGSNKLNGRGALANGGGGGNGHNAGGGGGSNSGIGGFGGYQLFECNFSNYDNRGIGGKQLPYNNALNKVYLGGGGGGGHKDGLPTVVPSSAGGNGGGIVIIKANKLISNNFTITANGDHGKQCDLDGFNCLHDGMGGGGGGGTLLLDIENYVDNSKANAAGGKGADLTVYSAAAGRVGPGGGGGGGVVWIKQSSLPSVLTIFSNGANGGVIPLNGNNPLGATNGLPGTTLYNLVRPIDVVPFKPNIDSVRIKDSLLTCKTIDFKGLGFTNSAAIVQWNWTFGDGGTANTQNVVHTYTNSGTYTVKLVVTDINGCKDSVSKPVSLTVLIAEAGNDTTICSNGNVSINLLASGGTVYSWSPAGVVSNPNIANPVATVNATTKLYVTVTNAAGCSDIDSVTITVNALPAVKANNDTAICSLQPLPLLATGAATYVWSPAAAVSNPTSANPAFIGNQAQQLIVTGTSALGCKANDTVQITVNPLPLVKTIGDTTLCTAQTLVLTTTGAQSYQWSPASFLSNPNAANPNFTGTVSQTYQVTGTDANGCIGKDTVSINLPDIATLRAPIDRSLCRQDTVILNGNNGPAFQYAWSPATGLSNPLAENPIFNATVTTPYVLTITEPICNLQRTFNVLVTVNPLPVVNATRSNDIDCSSPFSQLQASGAAQYNWQPINASIPNPVVTPTATTVYIVKGTDGNGCAAYDSVEVKVFANGKDFTEMPNSFTPNGDGLNDCYGPGRFWRNIVTMELMIYNRWGERVFYSTNPANCWDGTFKGVNAEANAYVYHLKVKTTCGDVVKKGHVILIR